MPTKGHPVVYGEKMIDAALPTILVYGHYDVQPAEDSGAWHSLPFSPQTWGNRIFARGAADDKGQFHMHLKALEVLARTHTQAANIKFLIEGEEEISSPALPSFIQEHRELLRADIVLISDNEMIGKDTPSLETGFRGSCLLELEICCAHTEVHSGRYGGAIANPIAILSKMLASLHDGHHRILVPHFYDDVREVPAEERAALATTLIDEERDRKTLGIKKFVGEKGYTTSERIGIRPSLELNGIWGGYSGPGFKTIIPPTAGAKLSARLVPDQSSADIAGKIASYLRAIAPEGVELNITVYTGSEPYSIARDSKGYSAASKAIQTVYGTEPVPFRDGGSLPLCHLMERALGIKSLLLGFGLPADNIHGINESFDIEQYFKGIETILHFHQYYSQ